jgi:23S rRNA pseudouridine1911/1915/1917 synthase
MKEVEVPENLDGARLDKALPELLPGISRARIRAAIEAGQVCVNGRVRPKGALVHTGERIGIEEVAVAPRDVPPIATPEAPLDVAFESADVIVVNKPAGQPCATQRPDETGALVNALIGRYPELKGVGYNIREPGLLHRLDTDTSGLVIVARTAPVFDTLRKALTEHQIEKTYLLVCKSADLPDQGTVAFPLANHPKDTRRVLACVHPRDVMRNAPRPASTDYEVVSRSAHWALVRVRAQKALRHQIRAHFEAMGHPLLGDTLYGGSPDLSRQALHAERVQFGTMFDVTAPMPEDMRRAFEGG